MSGIDLPLAVTSSRFYVVNFPSSLLPSQQHFIGCHHTQVFLIIQVPLTTRAPISPTTLPSCAAESLHSCSHLLLASVIIAQAELNVSTHCFPECPFVESQ